jgi:molybdenum cofactor biosynthesis enzyme MoaA
MSRLEILPPLSLLREWREKEGLSPQEIHERCKNFYRKIPTPKYLRRGRPRRSVGCPECKIKPYSKGFCRNCYHAQWRHRKKDEILNS